MVPAVSLAVFGHPAENGRVVWTTIFSVFAVLTVALVLMSLEQGQNASPVEAEAAALRWVGGGVTQEPRRDGDRWEIDVVRPNGSMVQVSLGENLELRGLDEEFGPAGTLAHDEVTGARRTRAVEAAFDEVGPGQVVGVERDSNREIEVGIRLRGGRQVEVELDGRLRVVEVETEDPGDE
jgi:hypothetical protein